MAKTEQSIPRIAQIAPAETLVIPVYNPNDLVGKELEIQSWEFKVSEKGGDYVTFTGIVASTKLPFNCTSFDRAIVAQFAALPADVARPLAGRIEPFGRYYQLK